MTEANAFVERHFEALFALAFLWVIGWMVISAIYRRSKGKPIRPEAPPNPIFIEKWTSGRSLRNMMTRSGGARNCLLVAVTTDKLIIQPHFPFTLGFLPEIYGLDWSIPRSSIKRVSTRRGIVKESLVIEFGLPQAQPQSVELTLREPAKFKLALGI